MMGRPGAGKGTQGKRLAKKLGSDLYSSGNRLREMAKGHGHVAEKIRRVIDRGELLPAWFSSHLFVEVLLTIEQDEPIVFEGACRRLHEAQAFHETAAWLERPYQVVFLDISDEEMERRLASRRSIEGRADDASDAIERRAVEYRDHTAHAIAFFDAQGTLLRVAGEGTVDEVHARVLEALKIG